MKTPSPPDAVAELIAKARDGAKFRFDKQSDRVRDLADALEDCRRDNATLNGQLKNHKGHIEYGIHQNNAAADRVMALEAEIAAIKADRDQLRIRLLTAAGDDLCRLTQEEIKELSSGAVKILPKEEFLASCKRFHDQIASTSGVLGECLTLAQMIAENERLKADLRAARAALKPIADLHWPALDELPAQRFAAAVTIGEVRAARAILSASLETPMPTTEHQARAWARKMGKRPSVLTSTEGRKFYSWLCDDNWYNLQHHPDQCLPRAFKSDPGQWYHTEDEAWSSFESTWDAIAAAIGLDDLLRARAREMKDRCKKVAITNAAYHESLIEIARGIEDEEAYSERAIACKEVASAIEALPDEPEGECP